MEPAEELEALKVGAQKIDHGLDDVEAGRTLSEEELDRRTRNPATEGGYGGLLQPAVQTLSSFLVTS